MGQKNATLGATIDQAQVIPGGEITGRIYLSVQKERVEADCLVLRFIGQESTCVKYTTVEKERAVAQYYRDRCKFFEVPCILAMFPEGFVDVGQYEFPFRVKVPLGLNPSFFAILRGDNGGDCRIGYYLESKLHRKGWTKWEVIHKLSVKVNPGPLPDFAQPKPPQSSIVDPSQISLLDPVQFPSYLQPIQHRVDSCGCFSQGSMVISLFTPTATLHAGDAFEVSYVLHNHSGKEIKAIEISVLEEVKWTARGKRRSLLNTLYNTRVDKSDLHLDSAPVVSHNPRSQRGGGIGDIIVDPKTLETVKEVLESRRFSVQGRLGSSVRATLQSTLLSCRHFIQLKVCTPFGTSNPIAFIPIVILPSTAAPQSSPFHTPPAALPPVAEEDEEEDAFMGTKGEKITSLPSNWQPRISNQIELPSPVFATPVMDPSEETDTFSSSTAGTTAERSYLGLLALPSLLRTSYYPVGELHSWIHANSADLLTAKEFEVIFRAISFPTDQLLAADMLLQARSQGFSPEEVVAIYQSSSEVVRVEVVKRLLQKCRDQEKVSSLLKSQLLPFEVVCLAALR